MRKGTEFILSADGQSLKLPVSPEEYSLIQEVENHSFSTLELGEIMIPGKKKPAKLSFSSFFPNPSNNYSFLTTRTFPTPTECKEMILGWVEGKKPVRVLISASLNMVFLISTFNTSQRDASGDLYFDISFTEYKALNVSAQKNPASVNTYTGLRERPKTNIAAGGKRKSSSGNAKRTHKVKRGESLYTITLGNQKVAVPYEFSDQFVQDLNLKTKPDEKKFGKSPLSLTYAPGAQSLENKIDAPVNSNSFSYASGMEWLKLAQANNISNPRKISEGRRLKLPHGGSY